MKIITLNCFLSPWSLRRKNRLSHLVKALVDQKPDVVFLQEVFFRADANHIIKNLFAFGFKDYFYSNALLIVSKYPLISRSYRSFKPYFSRNPLLYAIEILNWIYGKGYQAAQVNFQGQPIFLVNTHLTSAYGRDYGLYSEARSRQLIEICDYLKKEGGGTKQIIFGGDFNFDISSPSYKIVTNHHEFKDPLREIVGNTISTDNLNRKFFLMARINKRIDHIFIKGFGNLRTSGEILFKEPYSLGGKTLHISDHYGLALTFQI